MHVEETVKLHQKLTDATRYNEQKLQNYVGGGAN